MSDVAVQTQFRWRSADGLLVLLLGMVTAIGSATTDVYVPAMPALQHAFGVQPSAIQATLSIYLIGLAVGQLFHGPLSDRFGRRAPLLAGLAIYVSGTLLAAASSDIWVLLVARLIQALGASAGVVVVRAIVTDRFEGAAAARVHTMLMQILGLAAIFAPLLGGVVLEATSWRGIFLLLAAFGGLGFVAMLRLLPESLQPERRATSLALGQARAYAALLAQPRFTLLCLASSCTLAAMFALIMGSAFVFIDGFGWTPLAYAILYTGTSVGFLICGYANDWALQRWSVGKILWPAMAVQLATAVALLALAYVEGPLEPLVPAVMGALLVILISNLGFIHGNLVAAAMENARSAAGTGASILGVGQYGISALASAVAAGVSANPLVSMGGAGLAFTVVATAAFVGAPTLRK